MYEMDLTEEMISTRAHQRYIERGGEDGQDVDDWLTAEEELRTRLVTRPAETTSAPQRRVLGRLPKRRLLVGEGGDGGHVPHRGGTRVQAKMCFRAASLMASTAGCLIFRSTEIA